MALATRPKPPAHHKKRVGKHHKTTSHYIKPYLPYLPLLAIVAVGLVINSFLLAPAKVLGAQTGISSGELLAGTNQQRSAAQETPLNLDGQLSSAAQAKANDMVARDYWSHNTPDGQTPWTFMTAAGYTYQLAGENLAYGFDSSDAVISGWMNSPEHKANILNSGYADVGFGIASSANFVGTGPETVVVAMYGTRQASPAVNISFSVPSHAAASPAPAPTPAAPPSAPVPASSTPVAPAPQTAQQPAPTAVAPQSATVLPASRTVARIQLLTNGTAAWSTFAVVLIGALALLTFLLRHLRFWHKKLMKGELFIVRHFWLDVAIVTLVTASFVLSRAAGVIG